MAATLNVTIPDSATIASGEAVVGAVQEVLNQFTPDDLKLLAESIHDALNIPVGPEASSASGLIVALIGGRRYSPEERVALKLQALLRSFRYRQHLLAESLTASQVADLLGTTRQTPHDRVRSNTLLAVSDRGAWRFPIWQFDPNGPEGVIAGLPDVLRTLTITPLAKVSWFVQPNPSLENRTPLDTLKAGERERVMMAAQGVGVS